MPTFASQFTKVFRAVDLMREVGGDVYHRDWGWWDRAGDWNGPDFGTTADYLQKYDMGQLSMRFSIPSIASRRWPASIPTGCSARPSTCRGPRSSRTSNGNSTTSTTAGAISPGATTARPPRPGTETIRFSLAQDQGFREVIQSFLDTYPRSSFQSVNGGGNEAGYDYVRLSSMLQFSDAAIGILRNYYASLLFPPDKLEDNGDAWNPDHYDKATWRGLLCIAIMTTGDTWDQAQARGLRELFDIYHYLAAQGVVGRWVKVYRPQNRRR